jgi:hypothetical protein
MILSWGECMNESIGFLGVGAFFGAKRAKQSARQRDEGCMTYSFRSRDNG